MRNPYIFLSFLLFWTTTASAQSKPPVTTANYEHWLTVDGGATQLSYSGKYFVYQVSNRQRTNATTHFSAVDQRWEKTFEGLTYFSITNLGDREVGLALRKDSLWIITLGTGETILRTNVQSVTKSKAVNQEGFSVEKSKWILIAKKDKSIELINAQNEKTLFLNSVKHYRFELSTELPIVGSKDFLLKIKPSFGIDTIYRFDSPSGTFEGIEYSSASRRSYIQVVDANQRKIIEIGTPNRVLISRETINAGFDFNVAGSMSLIDSDSTLLFDLSPEGSIHNNLVDTAKTSLVLWTYLDDHFSLRPDPKKYGPARIAYAYNLFTDQVFALENDSMALQGGASGEWAIVNRRPQVEDFGVNLLRTKAVQPLQAISVKSNRRIYTNIIDSTIRGISPLKKYVFYLANGALSIFALNSERHHQVLRANETAQTQTNEPSRVQVAGWSADNDTLYFYYNFDIYMASCTNGFATRNLTMGYGAEHKICFALRTFTSSRQIQYRDIKFLMAIDYKNMEHGFYAISPGTNTLPEKLEFGPFYYAGLADPPSLGREKVPYPIKARGSESYLVTRSSVNEAPNLFFTKDFKHLTRLTRITPESNYNWMTSELIQYELPGKMVGNGILYKPENFDASRKYPLIITSYSEASPHLNAYIEPVDICNYCLPSIPTYVSNGYMVFVPDIYSPKGNTLQRAVETVKASLKALSEIKQVDMERVGITGCSFSGITTEFIITQVKGLKAAVASSALANPISGFNMLVDGGFGSSWYQIGQGKFGASLFENPQLYIDNTAILQADKIQTPLLIMHTTNDDRCPFYDAQQFFVALRNLNKKVWLLEYKKGIHGVFGSDMPDFGQRMRQFFDHYLMDKPAPDWMTKKTIDRWKGVGTNVNVKLKIDPSRVSASR